MYSIVYTTISDKEGAEELSKELLEEGLIACANYHEISSMYRWKGEIEKGDEVGMILKTREGLVDELIDTIEEIHPYETPCALSFEIEKGSDEYLRWIEEVTR